MESCYHTHLIIFSSCHFQILFSFESISCLGASKNLSLGCDKYLKYSFYPYALVSFSSVFMLNKCPNALKVHTYDRSSIWCNCAKLVEKLLQKQQERLLYFDVFRQHMSSYCIKPYMYGFYISRDFQGYQEHQNRSSYDKVMALRSWRKNKGLQQRRDVAETELPDVATLLHDVAAFGVGFGWIFSPF